MKFRFGSGLGLGFRVYQALKRAMVDRVDDVYSSCLMLHGLEGLPGIDRVVVDSDRQITLERHALRLAVVGGLLELHVEPILHYPVETDSLVKVTSRRRKLNQLLEVDLAGTECTPLLVVRSPCPDSRVRKRAEYAMV